MATYARLCATELATRPRALGRRRSRSPATSAAATRFDRALASFAEAYADQNDRDYQTLKKAAAAGRVKPEVGV